MAILTVGVQEHWNTETMCFVQSGGPQIDKTRSSEIQAAISIL